MVLSIILLNWNKKDLTLACMRSLAEVYKEELKQGKFEVIVVDNGSKDDSVEFLKQEIKQSKYSSFIKLITSSENLGFGRGNNLGVKHAKGKYVMFLNNDTEVKDTGFLGMIDFAEKNPDAAIVGGKMRNYDGTLQDCAGKFYTPWNVFLLLLGFHKYGLLDSSPKTIQKVDWVKGGLLMMRKSAFDKLEGFDPNIFLYVEDMELCYRANLEGYNCYFYPDVEVLHIEHGSGNRTSAIVNIYKNLLYFYKKHRSPGEYVFVKCALEAKARILVFFGTITGKPYLKETYGKALSAIR